jgi:dihydrofolate reductase
MKALTTKGVEMGRISVFNHITVDGFFAGPHGEIDWFKFITSDDDWNAYTHQQAGTEATLIFGRTTYEMMKSYWPTADAIKTDPGMANAVNKSPKVVFSKTLQRLEEGPNWKRLTLLHEIVPKDIRRLAEAGDMTILGSGTIVSQFAKLDLIDEYLLASVPIILGSGKSMFADVDTKNLDLVEARAFDNGIVLLHYQPRRDSRDIGEGPKQLGVRS